MSLRKFEEYLNLGVVRKQSPNKQRAISLIAPTESYTPELAQRGEQLKNCY